MVLLIIIGTSSCDFQADLETEDYGENYNLNNRSSKSIKVVFDTVRTNMQMIIFEDTIITC